MLLLSAVVVVVVVVSGWIATAVAEEGAAPFAMAFSSSLATAASREAFGTHPRRALSLDTSAAAKPALAASTRVFC